jgi:hypothetical protein
MSKIALSLTVAALFALQLEAACVVCREKQGESKTQEQNPPGFYHSDTRGGFVIADYLLWKSYQEDLAYGATIKISPDNFDKADFVRKEPNFDWNSGVRLGLGFYSGDRWDISLIGTYYYGSASKKTNKGPLQFPGAIVPHINGEAILNFWDPQMLGISVFKTHCLWSVNYGTLDLSLGRDFGLTERFTVHPFVGARGAIINQKYKVYNVAQSNFFPNPNTFEPANISTSVKAHNDIAGAGPRAGFDCEYHFGKSWFVLGGFSGTIILGSVEVKERFEGEANPDTGFNQINPGENRLKDNHMIITPNIEAYLGLGWDNWFNNNNNRFAIAALAEAVNWFDINQFSSFATYAPIQNVQDDVPGRYMNLAAFDGGAKRHGNLAFFGFTLKLQLDF